MNAHRILVARMMLEQYLINENHCSACSTPRTIAPIDTQKSALVLELGSSTSSFYSFIIATDSSQD
jgi:hypothetical protein